MSAEYYPTGVDGKSLLERFGLPFLHKVHMTAYTFNAVRYIEAEIMQKEADRFSSGMVRTSHVFVKLNGDLRAKVGINYWLGGKGYRLRWMANEIEVPREIVSSLEDSADEQEFPRKARIELARQIETDAKQMLVHYEELATQEKNKRDKEEFQKALKKSQQVSELKELGYDTRKFLLRFKNRHA